MRILWVITLLECLWFQQTLQASTDLLKVSVYYESLCPDSIRFITQQLQPAYQKIGSSLLIDFVPYGKANHEPENGTWTFRCQHGPDECWGNKAQACGIAEGKSQADIVEFVNCVMGKSNPASEAAINDCAPKLGITGKSILDCTEGNQGTNLLVKHGDQTHALDPAITFVPTIVFNGKYDDGNQEGSLRDFLGTACNAMDKKHKNCPGNSETTSTDLLKVSIYYESLCPDSVRFITQKLQPAYQKIGTSLLIDFVPYGKAHHEKVNGTWTFDCQHGPNECWGNKAQACGIAEGKNQDDIVEFVNCVMGKSNPASEAAIYDCAPKLGTTGQAILDCSESPIGSQLLVKYGDQTHAVDPVITFIPTIVFNDKYDAGNQEGSLRDFLRTACKAMDRKHKECPADSDMVLSFLDL